MSTISVTKDLTALRKAAHRKIDMAAEQARARYITTGSGQALEYRQTQTEAETIQSDPAPADADYPMLVAERDAQIDAGGASKSLSTIASEVLTERDNWNVIGKAIKQARRSGKLKVDNDATPAAIDATVASTVAALDNI